MKCLCIFIVWKKKREVFARALTQNDKNWSCVFDCPKHSSISAMTNEKLKCTRDPTREMVKFLLSVHNFDGRRSEIFAFIRCRLRFHWCHSTICINSGFYLYLSYLSRHLFWRYFFLCCCSLPHHLLLTQQPAAAHILRATQIYICILNFGERWIHTNHLTKMVYFTISSQYDYTLDEYVPSQCSVVVVDVLYLQKRWRKED